MSEQGVSRDQVMTLVVEARIRLCEDRTRRFAGP